MIFVKNENILYFEYNCKSPFFLLNSGKYTICIACYKLGK